MGGRTDPSDRMAMLELFDDLVLKRISEGQIEYRTQHNNGAWRVFRASARPLHDETGRITGVIASARDITEQQRLQQQVIQSERLAAMGQMIAGVAHELNNPLTAILGVTELMRDQTTDETATASWTWRTARRAAPLTSCRACWFFRAPRRRATRCCICRICCSAPCSCTSIRCAPIIFRWTWWRAPIFPPCWGIPIS